MRTCKQVNEPSGSTKRGMLVHSLSGNSLLSYDSSYSFMQLLPCHFTLCKLHTEILCQRTAKPHHFSSAHNFKDRYAQHTHFVQECTLVSQHKEWNATDTNCDNSAALLRLISRRQVAYIFRHTLMKTVTYKNSLFGMSITLVKIVQSLDFSSRKKCVFFQYGVYFRLFYSHVWLCCR